ncbi:unnamed protein product [Diamesa tonsa]
MTLYRWTHWFWITTALFASEHVNGSAIPLSSFETISSSLKSASVSKTSALIQNDNAFQQPKDQQKLQLKQLPMTFSTNGDSEDVFDGGGFIGGASEFDSDSATKYQKDWLSNKPNHDEKEPTLKSIKLQKSENVPEEIVAAIIPKDYKNSTNLVNVTEVASTVLSSVTETVAESSPIKATTTQTTKLRKVEDRGKVESPTYEEHFLNVKILNLTTDATEAGSEVNETVEEIVMTEESNVTEVTELSERKSKVLTGYSTEAKVVNNISSRSTLQVNQLTQNTVNDDKLSSEALFVTDEDNGGITMNAGVISAICVGVIGSLSAISIMFVYVYRRRFLNKPQTLNEPDSSGYIDDSTIRDNSDEMYSLDNDSFLNSLEAMTIQNYWTDSVKHTKL